MEELTRLPTPQQRHRPHLGRGAIAGVGPARHPCTSGAFTFFATHYFEPLYPNSAKVANVHLDIVEHGDTIVLMHTVREGPASQSYGLQVAQFNPDVLSPREALERLYRLHCSAARTPASLTRQEKPQNISPPGSHSQT